MPRQFSPVPTYRLHKQSGLAIVTIPLRGGRRKDVTLGRYGSAESKAEYRRITASLDAGPGIGFATRADGVTVNEVLLAYLKHVDGYYRRADGTPTSEPREYRLALRPLRELYGHTPAGEFGPLALKTIRDAMVRAGLCRSLVNQRIGRVKRFFKWAASEQIVPVAVHVGLTTVPGLQRGRTAARETEPIEPVSENVVHATLHHLPRHVAGLVRFQLLTGCRPGEACALRRCDLDTTDRVWHYRPAHHKLAHRGKTRVIAIGPKARKILDEFPTFDPTAYIFDPAAAVREFHAARSKARETPLYASHVKRNVRKRMRVGRRPPGEKYSSLSYGHAVAKACDRAFPPPEHLARRTDETLAEWHARLSEAERAELKTWRRSHRWRPNQLRHTFATKIRTRFGLEAAQVSLGHARADVTQIYAEKNLELAATVAAKVG